MASRTVCIPNDPETHASHALSETLSGEPLILVVEDDWSTRRFICSVLKRATNALVIQASGPSDALSKACSIGRPADLLISDIGLHAAITGVDLAREFAAANPSTRVLLISGGDFPEGGIPSGWRFLAKPFPLSVFLDCVDELCSVAALDQRLERRSNNEVIEVFGAGSADAP